MSLSLDTGNFKDAYISGTRVREMWFRGNLIYVKKQAPEVTLTVTKNTETGKIVISGRFEDYAHKYRYYDDMAISSAKENTHGILYSYEYELGSRVLTYNSARKRVSFGSYKDDGSFVYNLVPEKKTLTYCFRAFVSYQDRETGKQRFAYSDTAIRSYNSI